MARTSIILIKASLTPDAAALNAMFGDLAGNVHVASAGRINLVGQVPFDADDMESFGKASAAVSAFKIRVAGAGTMHKFEAKITTVDEADAPPQLPELEVGDETSSDD